MGGAHDGARRSRFRPGPTSEERVSDPDVPSQEDQGEHEHGLPGTPRRRRRRRLRRAAGGAEAAARAGRGHARRPAQLPSLPAAHLPGRDGRAVAAARSPIRCARSSSATATSASCWPRSPTSTSTRASCTCARSPTCRRRSGSPYDTLIVAGGSQLLVLRPRRLARARGRGQVARERARGAQPPPQRLRGRRGRAEPRARATPGSRSSSSAPGPPASRWPGRSPSWRATRCAATSARSTPARARILLVEAADRVLTTLPALALGEGRAVAAAPRRHGPHRPHRRRRSTPTA